MAEGEREQPRRRKKRKSLKGVACDICNKRLRSRFCLALHMAVHTGEKKHVCKICGKGFQLKGNLATHTARVHLKQKPFECKDCGKTFGYSSHFKTHVMKMHFLEKVDAPDSVKRLILHPHKCELCSLSFENNYRLVVHQKTHAKPFSCGECSLEFATRSLHAIHMAHKHSQFPCDACELKFCNSEDLELHVRSEHEDHSQGDRKKNLLACTICGKLILRESMNKHVNVHTRQRIYQCGYCNKQFLESSQRKTHERIHTGEKPYLCDVCGKAHAQYGNLMVHRRKYHSRVDKLPSLRINTRKRQVYRRAGKMKERVEVNCTGDETLEEFRQIAKKWFKKRYKANIIADAGGWENESDAETDSSDDNIPLSRLNCPVSAGTAIHVQRIETCDSELTPRDSPVNVPDEDCQMPEDEHSLSPLQINREAETKQELEQTQNIDNVSGNNYQTNFQRTDRFTTHNTPKIQQEGQSHNASFDKSRQIEKISTKEESVQTMTDDTNRTTDRTVWSTTKTQIHSRIKTGEQPKQNLEWLIFERICEEEAVKPFANKLKGIRETCLKKGKGKRVLSYLLTRLGKVMPDNQVLRRQENGSFRWHCWNCSKGLHSKSGLARHLLIHQSEDTWPYRCDTCNKRFKQSNNYKEHVLYHKREFLFYCQTCGRGFRHKTHFNKHLAGHEDPEKRAEADKKYPCQHCAKVFSTMFHRTEHERSHTKEKPYLCKVCGAQFGACSTYNRHARTHLDDKPYQCPVCNATFKEKASLGKHKETHSGIKRFLCDCGKRFSHKQSIKKHKMVCSASGIRLKTKPHECLVCGKRFLTRHDLKRHVETHDSERKYTCTVCNVRLKTWTTLRRHIVRRHHGVKSADADFQTIPRKNTIDNDVRDIR